MIIFCIQFLCTDENILNKSNISINNREKWLLKSITVLNACFQKQEVIFPGMLSLQLEDLLSATIPCSMTAKKKCMSYMT